MRSSPFRSLRLYPMFVRALLCYASPVSAVGFALGTYICFALLVCSALPIVMVLWLLLTSCSSLLLRVFFTSARPPRVSVTTFPSYICCIYTLKFGQYWTLFWRGNSSVSSMPYIQFLFVRPRLCLWLPSDSTSRWTPLPLANSSYCQACSGLSPPSYYACRAHQKKMYSFHAVHLFYCPVYSDLNGL